MTSFLTCAFLLAAVASAFIVPTLWRTSPHGLARPGVPQRWTAVWLVTGLVFAVVAVYVTVGSPQALAPQFAARSDVDASAAAPIEGASPAGGPGSMTPAQIEGMVARLAQRLQTQPNDPAGWRMLARSYETLQRFPQAVEAYRRLLALQPPDADVLTDYAVTLGMSEGQTLIGEPEAIINQALKLDPHHIQALALSGSAAFEAQDHGRAIAQWTKILTLIPPDAEMRPSIERNIAKAQSLMAERVARKASAPR